MQHASPLLLEVPLALCRPGALCAALAMAVCLPTATRAAGDERGEIVVTGQGLDLPPAAASYDAVALDRERLEGTGSGRLEDALAAVAGFQQFRRSDSRSANPSAQGITLRALGGNATSRTLVLLDGVPQADPFFGYIPFSAIDPALLAGVRVTRGGGAGAFGSGAVAGTVEMASAGPAQLGLARGEALVSDRGETDLAASFAPRLGSGFAVVSGQWQRGQGFWTTPESQRGPASVRARYASWSGAVRAVAPLGRDFELQSRLAAFADHRTLRFAGADSAISGQDASLRLIGRGAWQVEALGYVQARDFTNVVISSTSFRKTLDQYATPSTGLGAKLELRPPVGEGRVLRLGADWRRAVGTGYEAAFNPGSGAVTARRSARGANSDLGLYAEGDLGLGRIGLGDLVLTAGVRADRWSVAAGRNTESDPAGAITTNTAWPVRSGWEWSGRGGAVLRVSPVLSLRGSAYSGIRQPTLNELYRSFTVTASAPGGGTATTRTSANSALANERLEGFEAGLDLAPLPGITLSATLFDNRVKNAIANVTTAVAGSITTRQRRNVDAVRTRGVELGAGARLGAFRLDVSAVFTDARVQAAGLSGLSALIDGKRPAQTPRVALSATAAWAPRPGWRLALTARHVGAQWEDDLQTDLLPPATTLDAFVQVPLTKGSALVLRGENLLGEQVVTRSQGGSLDLGTPRTVWAGLRVGIM